MRPFILRTLHRRPETNKEYLLRTLGVQEAGKYVSFHYGMCATQVFLRYQDFHRYAKAMEVLDHEWAAWLDAVHVKGQMFMPSLTTEEREHA